MTTAGGTDAAMSTAADAAADFGSGDLSAFSDALAQFGDHARRRLFAPGADGADGDLAAMPALLDEARAMGLVADPAAGGVGADFGVWGDHVHEHGCRLSLLTLGSLAETCAGLAAAVHAQGLGCLALAGWGAPGGAIEPGTAVAAAMVPPYGVALDQRTHHDAVRLSESSGRAHLDGCSPFVWSAGAPDLLAVLAHDDRTVPGVAYGSWTVVAVGNDTAGVRIEPAGRRIGLRATDQARVTFEHVEVAPGDVVARGEPAADLLARLVACDWLGLAAVGLGTARAAVRQAQVHAVERHQGGRAIARHAAVRLLLAEASHHLRTLAALLDSRAERAFDALDADDLLRWSTSARLGIGEHAFVAVTNCVQVLGGYGYMDDHGISKRLRDVSALMSRHGSREQVLLLLDELDTRRTA